MKKCPYCGAENPDDALVCQIDQTPLPNPSADAQPAARSPARPKRLRGVLRYAVPIIVVPLLYLLSFGPVSRYGGEAVYQSSITTTNSLNNGATIIHTTRFKAKYPHWISVVYYPAFKLRTADRGAGIYSAYLELWGLPHVKSPDSTNI
jgi:hypothetical protein